MTAPLAEQELIAAARDGNRAALGQLLLSHSESLSRYVAVKMPVSLRRHVSAEDILQQSYSVVFRDIAQFEPRSDGSFYGWLKTIVDHQLQNTIKSLGRQKRGGHFRRIEAAAGENRSMRELLAQLAAETGTASVAARRNEAVAALNVALAELSEDHRNVIRLRFLEGHTVDETAEVMGRSPAGVRSLADRAKKQLREAMGRLSLYLSSN